MTQTDALRAGYTHGAYRHDVVSFGFPNETRLSIRLYRPDRLPGRGTDAVVAIDRIPRETWERAEVIPH